MNIATTRTATAAHILARKAEAYTILDEICRTLELSATQLEAAETAYNAVAAWLAAGDDPALQGLSIYLHGSTALGTTVKPVGRDENDVDLIGLTPNFSYWLPPAELKRIYGDRLRQHDTYAPILEEKKRCWRLNYAGQFHLDISPTIPNLRCANGGELVPDKQLRSFKPTNPKGYRALFERRALLMPKLRLAKATMARDGFAASLEQFPKPKAYKGVLRRIIQLLKRHRDIMFLKVEEDIAPISIIITTLAAQAYEFCVEQFEFDTELDVVYETIRMMPHFIEHPVVNGRRIFSVPNETTEGENFAERWNSEPERARAFNRWHAQALTDFEGIASLEGIDTLTHSLEKALGHRDVRKVMDARTNAISAARSDRKLYVAPAVGLTMAQTQRAVAVPRNTHFGD
jgi:hypothetical protein